MYLRKFRLDEFIKPSENAASYPEMPSAKKVCSICTEDDPETAEILGAVFDLEQEDRNAFRNGMSKLLKIARTGQQLTAHYDEKQLHNVHDFHYKGKDHTILRIRTNDIRTLFFYAKGNVILLLDAFPKHSDKLTKAQKLAAQRAVEAYLDAPTITYIEG